MEKPRRKIKLTPVSTMHYLRLVYRGALFLVAAAL